jgi:hypothetical protein
LKEKLHVSDTLKDVEARVEAVNEQKAEILEQIRIIETSDELQSHLKEYFADCKDINDRDNQEYLEAFCEKIVQVKDADRAMAVSLTHILLENLAPFERFGASRNKY